MKKYLIVTISLFSLLSCKNQSNTEKKNSEVITEEKYTEIIDNKLVYDLINQVLSKNHLYKNCGAIVDRKTFIITNGDEFLLKDIDTIFSESDKKFIVKQYRNGNWFILNQKLIKNKKIIELDTAIKTEEQRAKFWKKIAKENNCVGHLSVPLFNLKKNMAVVECQVYGERGTFLYKVNKNNNEWELYRTLKKIIE
jgi:hypothetical protein